jgi:hypothetical protein
MAKQLGIQRRLELEEKISELERSIQHQTYIIAVMVNMQGGEVTITRKDVEAVQTGLLHERRDPITDSIILTMESEDAGNSND